MSTPTTSSTTSDRRRLERRVALAGAAIALAAAGGAYRARRGHADGIPPVNPLQVAAYLEQGGIPVEGMRTFAARIYPNEMATTALCQTPPVNVEVRAGHFRLPISELCTDAVQRTPDAWLQLVAVGSVGEFPRVKFGAVPYTLEAGRVAEVIGPLALRINALTARRAQRPTECPTGYARSTTGVPASVVLCRRGNDEVVRVGAPPSHFWIDRYEATLWPNDAGDGVQAGIPGRGLPETFGPNGTYTTPFYAVSRAGAGIEPSRSVTWAQAAVACRLSGKRLPSNAEWHAAASGTPDGTGCRITAGVRPVGMGSACRSRWGAEDMIGNAAEWVGDLAASAGDGSMAVTGTWPDAFARSSVTYNVTGRVLPESGASASVPGVPAGLVRGGQWRDGDGAGTFATQADLAPSVSSVDVGFRCVIAR